MSPGDDSLNKAWRRFGRPIRACARKDDRAARAGQRPGGIYFGISERRRVEMAHRGAEFEGDSLGAECHPFLPVGRHDVVRGSRAILGWRYGTVCSAEVRMKD
jgi:hypothetical protein